MKLLKYDEDLYYIREGLLAVYCVCVSEVQIIIIISQMMIRMIIVIGFPNFSKCMLLENKTV